MLNKNIDYLEQIKSELSNPLERINILESKLNIYYKLIKCKKFDFDTLDCDLIKEIKNVCIFFLNKKKFIK